MPRPLPMGGTIDDDRNPDKDRHPSTPDGYFNFPEGRGQVVFLDDDGRPMTPDEFDAYLEEKRKDHRVIGSGTKEDPYRAPGTPP